jgi:hypothetical protein
MKRVRVIGVTFAALLALGGLLVSAPAQAAFKCYEVSRFKELVTGGQYANPKCEGIPTKLLLQGRWILAELLTPTTENLWCAKIALELAGGFKGNDGAFTDGTCETKLTGTHENESNFTEVVVPKLSCADILGAGSSLQKIAQENVWIPDHLPANSGDIGYADLADARAAGFSTVWALATTLPTELG